MSKIASETVSQDATRARRPPQPMAERHVTKSPRPRMKLRETEHRIINSLQLVASLLRDSTKSATCDLSRQEIHVAHQRVMSVISLQHELYRSKGEVHLNTYLSGIARSIDVALVARDRPIRIVVRCDAAKVDAAMATAIGLIVTELLINSIKHAFPEGAGGTIRLSFAGDRGDWHLVVSDDGVGAAEDHPHGLGSNLVSALSTQLDARLLVSHGTSGYRTELIRAAS